MTGEKTMRWAASTATKGGKALHPGSVLARAGSAPSRGTRETADGDPWVGPLLEAARNAPPEPESLWHLRSADGHSWWTVLHFHGESAVEAQIYRDGELVLQTKAEAVE